MMDRAMEIADQFGIGVVALKNANHWMRGGGYGWQAAEKAISASVGQTPSQLCHLGAQKNAVLEQTLDYCGADNPDYNGRYVLLYVFLWHVRSTPFSRSPNLC